MKEAALFFADYLVEDPKTGWLITGPVELARSRAAW